MAPLVRIAANFRTVLAPHVSLQLMDWRRLRPTNDIQRDGLMHIAAEALHFEIEVTGVERIAERRGRLRRSKKAEDAFIPRFAGKRRSASLRASVARSTAARTDDP
jgi:hypothetical protein